MWTNELVSSSIWIFRIDDTKYIEISNYVAVIVDSYKDKCLNLESEVFIFDAQQRSKG